MVVQMISVGGWSLDLMLSKIAAFYDDEIDVAVDSMTALLEPVVSVGELSHDYRDVSANL